MRYKVSFIDAPDGRVLDTTTETELGVIRAIASRLPMVGEDQLLVIEPVDDAGDPYCGKHGRRFDPAVGCPECLAGD